MQLSMFSLEEHPANLSQSLDCEREWMIRVATWPSPILLLLTDTGLSGLSGKTCPVSCQATEDGTLVPLSGRWANSGMGGPIESWTLNTSEWPNDAVVCSLSDVLETGELPQRYFLSPRACAGILRRAEKRGKSLPPSLAAALQAVALAPTSTATAESSHTPSKSVEDAKGGGKGYLGSDEVAFTLSTLQDQTIAARMVAFGEYVEDGTASAMKARDYKDATDLVAQPIPLQEVGKRTGVSTDDPRAGIGIGADGDPMFTLQAGAQHGVAQPVGFTRCDHGGDAVVDGTPTMRCGSNYSAHLAVAQPIGFNARQDPDAWQDRTGPVDTHNGTQGVAQPIAWTEELTASVDVAGTIQRGGAGGRHDGVAVPVPFGVGESPDTAHCLRSGASKADKHESTTYIAQPVGVDIDNTNITGDCSGNILAGAQMRSNKGMGVMQAVGAFFAGQGAKAGSIAYSENVSPTLKASDSGTNRTPSAHIAMQVRRLTPTECERLQGFPDGYTDIQDNTPDGPRYKALGNSMAVPVMRWIGQRVQSLKETDHG